MENEIRRFVIGPRRFQDRSILPRFARIISHSNYALPLSALSIRACHTRLRMAFHCQLRSIIHHFRLLLSRYILSDNIRADSQLNSFLFTDRRHSSSTTQLVELCEKRESFVRRYKICTRNNWIVLSNKYNSSENSSIANIIYINFLIKIRQFHKKELLYPSSSISNIFIFRIFILSRRQ